VNAKDFLSRNPELKPLRLQHSRYIKYEFFLNEDVAALTLLARIFWVGLWTISDKHGRFPWKPKTLKAQILPHDDANTEVLLAELESAQPHPFVRRYEAEGQFYGEVVHWNRHQPINKRERESHFAYPGPADYPPARACTCNVGEGEVEGEVEVEVEEETENKKQQQQEEVTPVAVAGVEKSILKTQNLDHGKDTPSDEQIWKLYQQAYADLPVYHPLDATAKHRRDAATLYREHSWRAIYAWRQWLLDADGHGDLTIDQQGQKVSRKWILNDFLLADTTHWFQQAAKFCEGMEAVSIVPPPVLCFLGSLEDEECQALTVFDLEKLSEVTRSSGLKKHDLQEFVDDCSLRDPDKEVRYLENLLSCPLNHLEILIKKWLRNGKRRPKSVENMIPEASHWTETVQGGVR
jgi:hypothetical protein